MESPNPFSREAFLAPTPPPKAAKPSRRPSRKWIVAGLAGAALVGVGSFLVLYFVREHRHNPYATMQNGMKLRSIHASDYEPFHKDPNSTAYELHYPTVEIELPRGARLQSVQGRASTGDTVLLGIGSRQTLPTNPLDLIWGDRQSVWINLPQFGVPSSFKWVDVTVEDSQKRRGTWRVYGLPTLNHVIPSDTPLHEAASGPHGIILNARAWQAVDPYSRSSTPYTRFQYEIKANVPPAALSTPHQSWGLEIQSVDLEWEPPRSYTPFSEEADTTRYEGSGPLTGAGFFLARTIEGDASLSPTAQHLARINARLVRYDAAIESVMFHDLPLAAYGKGRKVNIRSNGRTPVRRTPVKGTILTTPSGIQLTLDSLTYYASSLQMSGVPDKHSKNDVAAAYGVSLAPNFRAGAQVTRILTAVLAEKNACASTENGLFSVSPLPKNPSVRVGNPTTVYLLGAKNAGQSVLPALTISVARQTEREAIPISFVVPIRDVPPSEPSGKN